MEITFQSHHAAVAQRTRLRAARGVEKIAKRLPRVVAAVVRFEEDGPMRRVEVVLQAGRGRVLVAEGKARYYGPAVAAALEHLQAQARSMRHAARTRARKAART